MLLYPRLILEKLPRSNILLGKSPIALRSIINSTFSALDPEKISSSTNLIRFSCTSTIELFRLKKRKTLFCKCIILLAPARNSTSCGNPTKLPGSTFANRFASKLILSSRDMFTNASSSIVAILLSGKFKMAIWRLANVCFLMHFILPRIISSVSFRSCPRKNPLLIWTMFLAWTTSILTFCKFLNIRLQRIVLFMVSTKISLASGIMLTIVSVFV
jgi:hypothetical protein